MEMEKKPETILNEDVEMTPGKRSGEEGIGGAHKKKRKSTGPTLPKNPLMLLNEYKKGNVIDYSFDV